MRKREQPPGLGMFGPQRDDLAEADRRLTSALLAVQQDAQVLVRIRMRGIDADGRPVRRFGLDWIVLCP
jgi:hypothetical protein